MAATPLDVITIGRSCVDLYGQQLGGRFEDVSTFVKSVGGSPTNIAIGAARLGLKTAVLTAVGDEQMGNYIREQLTREGVDLSGVKVDRTRLTAFVMLGIVTDKKSPHIFLRENCADMALTEDDVDPDFIRRARALVVTGTHFSAPGVDAMSHKAIRVAKDAGMLVAFDVDYRPNLWGLAGHEAGEARYIESATVSAHLQRILPFCDVIVGTEEEIRIAGGHQDLTASLRAIRALSKGVIVLKRGAMGCTVFEGAIPDDLSRGIEGPGFEVEVLNTLGAGDGFMAGLLRGWLRDEGWQAASRYANACGAFAVSRTLCSAEYPSSEELERFLEVGSATPRVREDRALSHLHWCATRPRQADTIRALAIDHRMQLEALADAAGVARVRLQKFKQLAIAAAKRVANGRAGYGTLLDDTHGQQALFDAAEAGLWIGRPVELPGSRPLHFERDDLGSHLIEWPLIHTVKCLAFYHPDDPAALCAEQEATLLTLHDAARTVGRQLLVEIISSKHGKLDTDTTARVLERLYELGIQPDWWKLEPQPGRAAWDRIADTIAQHDAHCHGVMLLGLDAPADDLAAALALAASVPIVKGFAIGRTIFAEPARRWLSGELSDENAVATMARSFAGLCDVWDASREGLAH